MQRWRLSKRRQILLIAAIAGAMSSTSAFATSAVDDDRCKVANSDRQAKNERTTAAPNGNSHDKLSDCNGVLEPPAVGDSELEKPAPKLGKTPVIKPHGNQDEQQNNRPVK